MVHTNGGKSMANNDAFETHKEIRQKQRYIIPRDWIYNGIKVLIFIADRFLYLLENKYTHPHTAKHTHRKTKMESTTEIGALVQWLKFQIMPRQRKTKTNEIEALEHCIMRCDFNGLILFPVLSSREN